MKQLARRSQKGFTIIELMIAMGIFAVLLLVVLGAVTQVGRMYYKGVSSARTQEATRTIIERITQEIQYSGSDGWNQPRVIEGSSQNVMCVGNSRFFWVPNRPKSNSDYGLWTDDSNTGADACDEDAAVPTTAPAATNPRELLTDGMRIVNFDVISTSPGLYTVTLRIVYWSGDDAELDTTDGEENATCRGGAGSTFCSVSELTSTVYKRL